MEPLNFPELVEGGLSQARALCGHMHTAQEAHARILDRVETLKDIVNQRPDRRDHRAMLDVLVQMAAMCQQAAEDLGLVYQN